MKTLWLLVIFSIFAFSGILYAYAEEPITQSVVINEIDTNPPGDDTKAISEWVELYNPTGQSVDIGGWKIASTVATKKTLTIPVGVTIRPGQFLVFSYTSMWFSDISEKVQLRDKSGQVIDETPVISDQKNDFSSWQRKYDGLDTNTSDDWAFRMSSVGSSNGVSPTKSSGNGGATVSVNVDKQSYLFGETAIITGNVSKRVSQEKPFFSQQQLVITIDGPGKFYKTITMYPDLDLKFKTSVKLDQIQGAEAGTYDVLVTYGPSQSSAMFSAGDKTSVTSTEAAPVLSISADKGAYLPGQTAMISASTTKTIPLEGLKLSVLDPKGTQIYIGKLYPTRNSTFSANVFMNTVNPTYGAYNVIADYGTQHAETTFDLVQDVKDTEKIVLVTDKQYYGLGEPIIISGRSNRHVVALDLEVLQTSVTIGKDANKNAFRLIDQMLLKGDGTFEYKVSAPTLTLGDYRVTVSKEFGKSVSYFKIVEDPTSQGRGDKDFVSTDKAIYDIGDKLVISGHVIPKTRSTFEAIPVYITITTEDGKPLTFIGMGKSAKTLSGDPQLKTYSFSAIPDVAGNYNLDVVVTTSIFSPGNYVVNTQYAGKKTSATFAVTSLIDVTNKNLLVTTDKSVYGLGETVKLDGTLTTGQGNVQIVLTKPDGKTVNGGSKVDNNRFSWTWQAPLAEFDLANFPNYRGERPTVFGTYKIAVMIPSKTVTLFFKVSPDPANETVSTKPLVVTTDKPVYKAGEKLTVSGTASNRQQPTGSEAVRIDRVQVQVKTSVNKQIFASSLDFDHGGDFKTTYDLPITVFKDGTYKVTATYQKITAETTFEVKNVIPLNGDEKLSLSLNVDKDEYSPGDTVHISGSLNKVIFLNKMDLIVLSENDTKTNCGTVYCELGGKQIDLTSHYDSGLYKYDYVIPKSVSIGNYVVKVYTEFGTFTKTFKVVEKQVTAAPSKKISEKFNRITDSSIPISLTKKTLQGQDVLPKALQGSLVVPRGDESKVNMQISTQGGQCIIGQASGCLVSKSTKTLSSDYSVVQVNGTNLKIQYSGPGPLLETFSITPQLDSDTIQDSVLTVDIIKEQDKYSRFYYEITYVPAQ